MDRQSRINKNALVLLALRLARPALSMALVLAISRVLGAGELGRYTFALFFLFLFNEIAPLGLSAWIAREGARGKAPIESLLANAVSLVLLTSLALAFLMSRLGALLGYDPPTSLAIALLAPALVPAALNILFEAIFIARERMECIALSALIENVCKVCGAVVFLHAGFGLHAVLLAVAASSFVGAIVSVALLEQLGVRVRCAWKPEIVRALLAAAPTFLLTSLFVTLYWRIGVFMLGHLRSMEDLGYYGAAARLLELAVVIPQSLCLAFYPQLAAAGDDRPTLGWLARVASGYLALGSIPVALALSLLARPVLEFLYGDEFAQAAGTLAVLIWTVVPYAWVRYNAYVLVAADRQHIELRLNVALCAVAVLLNLLLIPRYGPFGAALAAVTTMSLYFGVQHAYLSRYLAGRAAVLRWSSSVASPAAPV